MSNFVTTGLYPFDPTGKQNSNYVDERQTLHTPGRDDYFFIIPKAAPFFTATLSVQNDQTKEFYVEGEDYIIGHYFASAMMQAGRAIAGSIRFLNHNISGVVRLQYQTLGGQWGFDDKAILRVLGDRLVNPLVRYWEQIDDMSATFPPVAHDHDVTDLIGFEEVVEAINNINAAIESTSDAQIAQHLINFDNPHRVTKAQVGLENILNYPMASPEDSRQATRTDRYMSAHGVGEAIRVKIREDFDVHAGQSNPHGTTAGDVGLGSVPNNPMANEAEARQATRTDRFMSPFLVSATIDELVGNRLSQHIANQQNPHGVTPELIGAYSVPDIDTMLNNKLGINDDAVNALRAYGYTEDQLRDRFLQGKAFDSHRLDGRTYEDIVQAAVGGDVENAIRFDGLTGNQWRTNITNEITQAINQLTSKVSGDIDNAINNARSEVTEEIDEAIEFHASSVTTQINEAISGVNTSIASQINTAVNDAKTQITNDRSNAIENAITAQAEIDQTARNEMLETLSGDIEAEVEARVAGQNELSNNFQELMTALETSFDNAAETIENA